MATSGSSVRTPTIATGALTCSTLDTLTTLQYLENPADNLWERTMAGSDSNRKILAQFLVSSDRGT
jgi:hypothetical protein